jgi:hypothetical protein
MNRRKLLLIDTGPLRELITFRAVFNLGFERLRKDLLFVSDVLSYETFGQYIGSFQTKSTTASVIVELDRWIRKTHSAGREQIWSLIYDEFRGMRMEEQIVKLLDMPMELVTRCGPTDVSLLTLALQQFDSEPVVLTIDRELVSECSNARIHTIQIQEIIGRPDVTK